MRYLKIEFKKRCGLQIELAVGSIEMVFDIMSVDEITKKEKREKL